MRGATRTSVLPAVAAALVAALVAGPLTAADLSGEIAFESRIFPSDALDARQQDSGVSIGIEPEFYHD
jgi:hypothetical protein